MIYIKDIEDKIINILLKVEENVLYYENSVTKEYINTLNSIKRVVYDMFSNYGVINDNKVNIINYTALKQKLTKKEIRDLKQAISEFMLEIDDDTYYRELDKLLDRVSFTRLDYFDISLYYFLFVLYQKKCSYLTTELEKEYKDSYYSQYYLLANTASIKVPNPSPENVDKLVRTSYDGLSYKTAYKNDLDNTYKEILKEFQQSIAAKRPCKFIMEQVEKSLAKSNNRSRVRCRTEANNKFNLALKQVFNDLKVRQYKYSAILDERTTEICRGLHGKVFKVSEAKVGVNYPPMHPNCRSSAIPYGSVLNTDSGRLFNSWKEYINEFYPECRLSDPTK